MSPAMMCIIILTVCVNAASSTDLVLKEGDYYNFTCTSDEDKWYVTKNNVSTLIATCTWYGNCVSLDDRFGVEVGLAVGGGTYFYFAVYRNMTEVSCSSQNWNLIVTDLMDIRVSLFILTGQSNIYLSAVTIDVGDILYFKCLGLGPRDTSFTISTNRSMVTELSCKQYYMPSWLEVDCSMRVDQCGVLFDVYCQAGYDVTTRKTIRVSSSKCQILNQDPLDIRVDAFTLLGESGPLPSIVVVDVGRTLEFQCTGHGPLGTTFTITTNNSMANVTSSVQVKEGETTVNVNYVMTVEQCGVLFEVSCQALYDVTTKKTIRVSFSKCPSTTQDPLDIRVDAFTLLGEWGSFPTFVAVDVGCTLEFQCTGHGPPGTAFTISATIPTADVTPCVQVNEGKTTVNVNYVMTVEECGVVFSVYCQAGYDVTTRKTIRVSSSKCKILIQDPLDIRVDAFTLNVIGESGPLPTIVTVDVGRTLEFKCTGHGPRGTTFTISANIPTADVTPSAQVNEGETTVNVNYVMTVEQCGVSFEVSCQALNYVSTKTRIRFFSYSCPRTTQVTSYYTTAPTFKPDSIRDPSDIISFSALMDLKTLAPFDVTFACSGYGAAGTKLHLYNVTSQDVIFSCDVPDLKYTVRYWECGTSFVVGCGLGDDASALHATREITFETPECSPSSDNSHKLILPLTVSGSIFVLCATGVYLAYRVRLVKRGASRNAADHGSERTTMTSLDLPPPHVNVSCTNASLRPPRVARAVFEHWSLLPSYSEVVRDPGMYKITSAASLSDRPPLYDSLFNQQATRT